MALRLCASCSRHVRDTETRCPFCDATVSFAPTTIATAPRLGRAAQMAIVATMLVGCHDEAKPPVTPAETVDASAPTVADAGPVQEEPPPPPNIKKPYGAPPADGFII